MHSILHLFISLLCLCIIGCSDTPNELKTAEQLMETAPDSSLQILRKLQIKNISGSYNKALYALLMIQALDKKDIKIENDSLTSIATGYFDDSDPVHAGYAWFYRARSASNRDSVNEQARNLLKAQEYSEKTNDNKLRGLIYGDKGIMYKNQLQLDSSIHYAKHAYKAFIQINDYRNSVLSLLNAGVGFLNLSKNDSALKYFFLAEKVVRKSNDTLLISTVYRSLGGIYYWMKDYRLALYYYGKVPLTRIALYDSNKYYLIAKTYIQINEIDSASNYLEKVTELQNMAPDYYELWKKISEKQGNTQKYIYYANKVNLAIDSIYKKKLEISFAGLEKKYKYQSLQITNQSLTIKNKQRGLYLLVTLFALSISIVLFLFGRLKVKKNEVEYQKDIANKKQELLEKEKENTAKEKENSALLERQLKLQNILLSNIKMHQTNTVKRPAVWRDGSKDTIEKQYVAFYNELKAYVDMEFSNFTIRLKEKHIVLTENDIFISCLLIAEFETGMIATILNIKDSSMNKQRHRLRTKLKLLNSENLLDYLLHF